MGTVQLVHYKRATVPLDSKMGKAPIVACCDKTCVATWAAVRKILPTEVDLFEVPATPRSVCDYCAACGLRIVDPGLGRCAVHGVKSCPDVHFLSSTAAYVFVRVWWKRYGESVPDEALELAEKTWDEGRGMVDGRRLVHAVRAVREW